MSGYVRRRGTHSYQIQIEMPPDPATGVRRRRLFTVKGNRKAAETALTKALYERDHGIDVAPDRITLEGLLARWLRDDAAGSVAPKTLQGYRQIAGRLSEIIGATRLQDLRPTHLQSCHRRLAEAGLAPRTVLHHHRVLREALAWAQRLQLVVTNPAEAVRPPPATPPRDDGAQRGGRRSGALRLRG